MFWKTLLNMQWNILWNFEKYKFPKKKFCYIHTNENNEGSMDIISYLESSS